MMGWIPWTRDEAETLYMFQVKLRRPRKAPTNRGIAWQGRLSPVSSPLDGKGSSSFMTVYC